MHGISSMAPLLSLRITDSGHPGVSQDWHFYWLRKLNADQLIEALNEFGLPCGLPKHCTTSYCCGNSTGGLERWRSLDAVCVISWILVIDWSRLTRVTIPRLPAELKEQSPWSSLTWIPPTAGSNLTVFSLMLKWCSKPVLVSYSHAAHSNFFWQPCSKDRGKHYLTEITKPAICMLKP